MGSIDTITWQALTLVLTLAGLVTTGMLWRLRGPASGLRMLGISLLPAAAYLTGTLRLLWEIGDALVSWAVRLTFSPAVWLGTALAGVSVLLFTVAGVLRRRQAGKAPAPSASALPRTTSSAPAKPTSGAAKDEDMDEIEAILKRHGIS